MKRTTKQLVKQSARLTRKRRAEANARERADAKVSGRVPRIMNLNTGRVRRNKKAGPLEAKLADTSRYGVLGHCEMCGANSAQLLEPAFDPSGNPQILCRQCRIGSAELLADKRKRTVHVFMQGGLIQDMQVPANVQVKVYDYDLDGIEGERIEADGKGERCTIVEWGPQEARIFTPEQPTTKPADKHPQTDAHLAACPSCMMAHDKAQPDAPSKPPRVHAPKHAKRGVLRHSANL